VLLRWRPGTAWPVLLAAVRDEFLERPWDPPGEHWPRQPGVLGGRDRISGGTWLAVDPASRTVAAVLNGAPLPPADRPSRGALPLRALVEPDPIPPDVTRYDTFHLVRAAAARVETWSWDGTTLAYQLLGVGDHIVVNLGADARADPLVPHFAPLLAALPDPPLAAGGDTATAWGGWVELLRGDGLDPADPRALLVAHEYGGRRYGSGSATLLALPAARHPTTRQPAGTQPAGIRYDFTAHPRQPDWAPVRTPG
jgi:hypothetical protein